MCVCVRVRLCVSVCVSVRETRLRTWAYWKRRLRSQERLKDSNFRLRKRDSNVCRAVLNVLTIAGFVIFATVRGPHLHSDAP